MMFYVVLIHQWPLFFPVYYPILIPEWDTKTVATLQMLIMEVLPPGDITENTLKT